MLSKKLIIGSATGTTVAAGGGTAAYLLSPDEKGPGRDIVTKHDWLGGLDKKVEKIGEQTKCEEYGWEWKENKCTIPEKITKDAHLEIKNVTRGRGVSSVNDMTSCINAGGAWWGGTGSDKCRDRDIILRGKFPRSIDNWELISKEVVETKIADENLKNLNGKEHWKVKRYGEDYVLIFLESKLSDTQKSGNWEFPSYYNASNVSINMDSVCKILEGVSEQTNENQKGLYLYNENKNTFWDCNRKGFVFVSY